MQGMKGRMDSSMVNKSFLDERLKESYESGLKESGDQHMREMGIKGDTSMYKVMDYIGIVKEELLSVKSRSTCIRESINLIRDLESVREEEAKFREGAIVDALKSTSYIIKTSFCSRENFLCDLDSVIAKNEENDNLLNGIEKVVNGMRPDKECDIMGDHCSVVEATGVINMERETNKLKEKCYKMKNDIESVMVKGDNDFHVEEVVSINDDSSRIENVFDIEVGELKSDVHITDQVLEDSCNSVVDDYSMSSATIIDCSKKCDSEKREMLDNVLDSTGKELVLCSSAIGIKKFLNNEDLKMMFEQEVSVNEAVIDVEIEIEKRFGLCLTNSKGGFPLFCEWPCNLVKKKISESSFNLKIHATENFRTWLVSGADIKTYIYDVGTDLSEILVATDLVIVRRLHFSNLATSNLVHSAIINGVAALLTKEECERTMNKPKFWWIPTTISRPNNAKLEQYIDRSQWTNWVGPLSECEKIYIPILFSEHWFIAIVDLEKKIVDVRDLLRIPTVLIGLAIVDELLRTLDHVFMEEINVAKGIDWSFHSFVVHQADSILRQCCNFECGIYVVKCMEAAYNDDKICAHGSKVDEQDVIIFQLCLSNYNTRRGYLLRNSALVEA